MTLARYTGLALQRLNGSAKKVKGQFYALLPHKYQLIPI